MGAKGAQFDHQAEGLPCSGSYHSFTLVRPGQTTAGTLESSTISIWFTSADFSASDGRTKSSTRRSLSEPTYPASSPPRESTGQMGWTRRQDAWQLTAETDVGQRVVPGQMNGVGTDKTFKDLSIDISCWETHALDHPSWRSKLATCACAAETRRITETQRKRALHKDWAPSASTTTTHLYFALLADNPSRPWLELSVISSLQSLFINQEWSHSHLRLRRTNNNPKNYVSLIWICSLHCLTKPFSGHSILWYGSPLLSNLVHTCRSFCLTPFIRTCIRFLYVGKLLKRFFFFFFVLEAVQLNDKSLQARHFKKSLNFEYWKLCSYVFIGFVHGKSIVTSVIMLGIFSAIDDFN